MLQILLSSVAYFTVFCCRFYCLLSQILLSSVADFTVFYFRFYCLLLQILLSSVSDFTVFCCRLYCLLLQILMSSVADFNVFCCRFYCLLLQILLSSLRLWHLLRVCRQIHRWATLLPCAPWPDMQVMCKGIVHRVGFCSEHMEGFTSGGKWPLLNWSFFCCCEASKFVNSISTSL